MGNESSSNSYGEMQSFEDAKSVAGRLIASAAVNDPASTSFLAEKINAYWDTVEQDPVRTEAITAVVRAAMHNVAEVLGPTEIEEVIERLWTMTTKLKKGFQKILDTVLSEYVQDPDHEGSQIELPDRDLLAGPPGQDSANN